MLEMIFNLFFGSGLADFFSVSSSAGISGFDSLCLFVLAVMAVAGTLFVFLAASFFKLLLVILNRE